MNDERLRIYLDDHLAMMVGESELAARSRSGNKNTPLEDFLARLEVELEAQKTIVKDVIRRIGATEGIGSMGKQGAAWFAEKLGRFKIRT